MSVNPALTFMMASNLTIIANFKDAVKPTNAITFPLANEKWSNSVITVTGKAGDNVGVVGVGVQINNGGWQAATWAMATRRGARRICRLSLARISLKLRTGCGGQRVGDQYNQTSRRAGPGITGRL